MVLHSANSQVLSHLLLLQTELRGSLIFWDCFSHNMTNLFSSAEEGEMSSGFLSAIICGSWNHSVAMRGLLLF